MIKTANTVGEMMITYGQILTAPDNKNHKRNFNFTMADIHAGFMFKLKSKASKSLPIRNKMEVYK